MTSLNVLPEGGAPAAAWNGTVVLATTPQSLTWPHFTEGTTHPPIQVAFLFHVALHVMLWLSAMCNLADAPEC